MNSYLIKHASEVFSEEFVAYLAGQEYEEIQPNHIRQIFNRIEIFEIRHKVQFVTLFANEYLVFRNETN